MGWGGGYVNVHLKLHTHVMLRWVWGGVGVGVGGHVNVLLKLHTHVMLRWVWVGVGVGVMLTFF